MARSQRAHARFESGRGRCFRLHHTGQSSSGLQPRIENNRSTEEYQARKGGNGNVGGRKQLLLEVTGYLSLRVRIDEGASGFLNGDYSPGGVAGFSHQLWLGSNPAVVTKSLANAGECAESKCGHCAGVKLRSTSFDSTSAHEVNGV